MSRMLCAISVLLAAFVVATAVAGAATTGQVVDARESYDGTQRLRYQYGALEVIAGQNSIDFATTKLKPQVPGFITRFKPELVYADGSGVVPRVDVLHLHHGVWIINGDPVFAAGEEKTILNVPRGYGVRHSPKDNWVLNTMIHNLLPNRARVKLVYEIDFVPDDAPGASGLKEAKIRWLDVAGPSVYPVFDVRRGSGRNGRYTFPDDASGAERGKIGPGATWQPGEDITLIGAYGHLHPGGLSTDLRVQRDRRSQLIFRSEAHYFEPAGAVSWDVATTVPPPDWKVAIKRNDRLTLSTTYDSSRASWYESMGIMPVLYTDGHTDGAADPFGQAPPKTAGKITHGPLAENRHKGGAALGLPDARRLQAGTLGGDVTIKNFTYGRGDLRLTGRAGRPPTVRAGRSLTFDNRIDDRRQIMHTITGCRAPCNRSAGVAYPLADGPVFDSDNLGTGPAGRTAASQKLRWRTPADLKPGTYTYFCRVHPFMRGAFRVLASERSRRTGSR